MTGKDSKLVFRWAAVWIAVVVVLSAVSAVRGAPDELQLVTEQEAAAAPEFRTRSAPPPLPKNGPLIKIVQPTAGGGDITTPFPLEIEFEPRAGGLPAKMETLKVTYLKLVELDITDRVKPHLKENRLLVKDCNIPQGRHRVKISIADRDGNVTAEIIEMRIR